MGRKRNEGDGGEEKQPKPKKIFIATFDMWDDGEITHDLVEKVQGERGAPKSWRLDPPEFMASVKARLSENKMKILAEMAKGLAITEDEIRAYYSPKASVASVAKALADISGDTPGVEDIPKASKSADTEDGFDKF